MGLFCNELGTCLLFAPERNIASTFVVPILYLERKISLASKAVLHANTLEGDI